jgi:N-acetylneuraminic acid mutarotase
MQHRASGIRRVRRALVISVLFALMAALGGCLTPTNEDGQPISKGTFLSRLVGICAGVNVWAAQQQKESGGVPPAQLANQLDSLIGAATVDPPDVDREQLDHFVDTLKTWDRALRHQADVLEAEDAEQTAAKKAAEKAAGAADAAAVSYGMPHLGDCHKQWKDQPRLPIPVQQAATAVVEGRIWVVGGLTGNGKPTDRTFVYDPVSRRWLEGPDLPMDLNHAMAVAYHNHLVVIGGWVPAGNEPLGTASSEVFRLNDDKWETLPPLTHPRGAGGAAVVEDQIIVVGGEDAQPVAQTEVFDGSTWRDGSPIPVPGDHLGAVSDGSDVYVVGGRKDFKPNHSTAALQRYDPRTNQWSRLEDMPEPRGGLGAAFVDDRIYAVGGETVTSAQNSVGVYDIADDSWTQASPLPKGRHGLGVAVAGDTLYAIGGATAAGHLNSTASVTGLSLTMTTDQGSSSSSTSSSTSSSSSSSSSTSSPTTSKPDNPLAVCPKSLAGHWGCLTTARLRADGGLDIRYTVNFEPSENQNPGHQHLHVFTAKPDKFGGIDPAAETIQAEAGNDQGSWVSLYSRDETVISMDMPTSGKGEPLDTSAPLLCMRVANGGHSLAKDRSGGVHTGNCVMIER